MDAETMAAACASTGRIVDGVRAEHLNRPTPCTEWDVRALLGHLIGTLWLGAALITDSAPEVAIDPGGLPADDLVGDDPAKAYRRGVEALLATATPEALARLHTTPFGEMPGAILGGFTTVDIAVHGWDLAVATGAERTLDTGLASAVLAFARQTVTDEMRAPRIGPAVPVAPDAPVTDQLVAHLGRTP